MYIPPMAALQELPCTGTGTWKQLITCFLQEDGTPEAGTGLGAS